MRFIDSLGAAFVAFVRYTLLLLGLLYLSVKVMWTDRAFGQRAFGREVLRQIYFTGVQAAGPVIVLALAVGAFAVVEGVGGIGSLSGAESLGQMVTLVVLRDVAPLLTGIVVIVRSVTAIAAELGVMRVQREIEALEVMGISPIRLLVTPRIVGGLLSLFALNVLFNAVALLGGFAIGWLLVAIPFKLFASAMFSAVSPADIVAFSLKIMVGGVGVFLIACYHGLGVDRSPTEVPVAVSRAALVSVVFLVMLHATVSLTTVLSSGTGRLLGGVL
ncbi:MAG: ABC transporter permease [Deltaproteobacteria bacterium]|nr:ABC transporter permease [Deltaproteobacteria bacterium]